MGLVAKVFSDSGISGVRVVVTTLKGIVIIPIITNLLGADSYGLWATIIAFVGLMASAGGIHLHGSLIRFSAGDRDEQTYSDIMLFSALIALAICSAIFVFGALVDLSFLFEDWPVAQIWLVGGSALLIFSEITLKINVNFPRSRGMVKLYELLRIGRRTLETIVLVAIFLLGGTIVSGIFGLAAVGILLNVAIVSAVVLKYDIPRPDVRNFATYVRYGAPMVPAALSNRLLGNADKYLILYLISPTAVGIYAVANAICKSLTDFTTILNPTLYPSVSQAWEERNMDELRDLYALVFRYYSIIVIPAFFGLLYLAYELMAVFSTTEIAEQGTVLVPILAIGYLLRGYDNPLEYILTSTKDTQLVAKATMISATVNVILNVVLILNYGIVGAAFATAFSHGIAFYLVYRYARERFQFDLPASSIVRAIVAGVVMLAILTVVPLDPSPAYSILVYPPLGAAVYFATLFLVGEFDRSEIRRAVNAIR